MSVSGISHIKGESTQTLGGNMTLSPDGTVLYNRDKDNLYAIHTTDMHTNRIPAISGIYALSNNGTRLLSLTKPDTAASPATWQLVTTDSGTHQQILSMPIRSAEEFTPVASCLLSPDGSKWYIIVQGEAIIQI